MFKKLLLGSALAISLLGPAYGATSVGISLTGTVQQILSITVTPTAAASALDLTALVSTLKIATVKGESNNLAGYKVMVSSSNQSGGKCTTSNGPCFHSPVGTGANMSFTLARNSVNVNFTGATGEFVNSSARSALGGDNYDAQVSYDGVAAALPQATNYTETLTFTVSNN